jgi:hypothetical protein
MAKPWWDPDSRGLSFSKPDSPDVSGWPTLIMLLALAGCAGQPPFHPAPVRFGRVDFLEAREASTAPVQVRLDRETFAPDDALAATVRFDPSLVGRKQSARLSVLAPDGTAAANLELADLRNTELVVHVHLRAAPPGRYFLRVESNALADEKPFDIRP